MTRWLVWALLLFALGCSSEAERGKNKDDRDRQRQTPEKDAKPGK